MSSIQQLQELVGDIVDSGSRIPGPEPLDTAETCPALVITETCPALVITETCPALVIIETCPDLATPESSPATEAKVMPAATEVCPILSSEEEYIVLGMTETGPALGTAETYLDLNTKETCSATAMSETCPVMGPVFGERYPRFMGTTETIPAMHDIIPTHTRTEKCQPDAEHIPPKIPPKVAPKPSRTMNGIHSPPKATPEPSQDMDGLHVSIEAIQATSDIKVMGDTHYVEATPGPDQTIDGLLSSLEAILGPIQDTGGIQNSSQVTPRVSLAMGGLHSPPEAIPGPTQDAGGTHTHTPSEATIGPSQDMVDDTNNTDDFMVELKARMPLENAEVTRTCLADINKLQETGESSNIKQTTSDASHAEHQYLDLNDDQMPQSAHKNTYHPTSPTPQNPIVPPGSHMQPEIPPPYQSNPNTPEVYRGPCRFHQNMQPSPYHSHPNTPGISRVPGHRFTHSFEDDSYSLNSTLTGLEVGHLQLTSRSPCHIASSSLESQFRLPINERGLFLQEAVFERAAPVLQSALREVLGRGWGPGRHTTMADEMVRYRNMRAGDIDGRTQVAVITRHDTYYLIVVDMHEYLEGTIQLKVGGCCSILIEGWLEMEDGDELVTYEFNRRFPTPDMAELKDISADLSSDGILCIIVPTISLDEISYSPGPQYNDSSYEPLVDISLYNKNTKVTSGRPGDNRNPRYAKYWQDSHHKDPSLQPLVDADVHGHDTTTSTVRLEGIEPSGQDKHFIGEGKDENSYTHKSCRGDSVSSTRPLPVVC